MKIECVKTSVGLVPATDMESDKFTRFKNGDSYEIDIKLQHNNKFRGKVFAFLNYCFEHWSNENEYPTNLTSFEGFREDLTILAGFKDVHYAIDGTFTVKAKSLSYAKMDQHEFEQCYQALIQAAMNTIFQGCNESYYNKLESFF